MKHDWVFDNGKGQILYLSKEHRHLVKSLDDTACRATVKLELVDLVALCGIMDMESNYDNWMTLAFGLDEVFDAK